MSKRMHDTQTRVAVTSRSFSRHPVLRAELLQRYAHVDFNDAGVSLSGDALIDFLKGHDRAIVALDTIDDAVLSAVPELKVISKYGVGLDSIDCAALAAHGVRLGWTGGVNKRGVAELTLAFMLSLLRSIPSLHHEVCGGTWRQRPGRQLTGKVVGIIGCGHIGKDLVQLLKPFQCSIVAYDIRSYSDFYAEHGVRPVQLDDLLSIADVVTIHVPLDASTRGMLSADRLRRMKPSAILINAARGGLVDEQAVATMLSAGTLAGAAFDVLQQEPPTDLSLLRLPNVVVTPHIGGSSEEAVLAMGRAAIEGLETARIPTSEWPEPSLS